MAGLDDEREARERGERQQETKVGGLEGVAHACHRIPAPVVSAMAPSIMRANDSRARIDFTYLPFRKMRKRPTWFRQPGGLPVGGDPWLCVPASRRVCLYRPFDR